MKKSWHKLFESEAAAKAQIPINDLVTFRLGFKKICVVHTEAGLFALEDACPHKMIALSKGKINEKGQIVCFWHQYSFDLQTGKEMTGKIIRNAKVYPLKTREDGLYVQLPDDKPKDEFSF
ncbi:MAG: Rieske (2Fe-2S) protein [Microscillaceae bacterium]|jgi:nitrite reductase/ring-hydroxylating ferredoxin subunit|nr:Rieske (2Fe-2S) protein [Microscillaceae bacterium]